MKSLGLVCVLISLFPFFLISSAFAQVVTDTAGVKRTEVNIGGYLQFHWIFDGRSNKVPNNEFLLRRARIKVEPTITQSLSAKIEIDVGKSNITTKDAYIEYKASKGLRFIAGQHKMPFSREELTSASKILFIERTNVNNVFGDYPWLGRDIGLSIAGKLIRSDAFDMNYQVGIFNGGGGAPEFNNAKQYAERITVNVSSNFSFGVNSSQKTDSNTAKIVTAHGVDLSYHPNNWIVDGELLYGNRTLSDRMVGGYGQVYYNWSGVELGLRYEKLLEDIHNSAYHGVITGEIGYFIDDDLRLRLNVENVHPQIGDSYTKVFTQIQARF